MQGFRSPNIPSTAEIEQIIKGKLFENIKSSSILLVIYVQPDMITINPRDIVLYHTWNDSGALFPWGDQKILLSDFDQKSLHLPKCLLSVNNNDIIIYN